MTRHLPTLKRKKIITGLGEEEDDNHEVADFSQRSGNPQKRYMHQQVRSATGDMVKITASSPQGPFEVRKYTDHGTKVTKEHSTLTTLAAAHKWAHKHLGKKTLWNKLTAQKEDIDTAGVPDAVPDYDMAEMGGDHVVPEIGLDDRLYTEDDENDKIVPADTVGSGRLYTT